MTKKYKEFEDLVLFLRKLLVYIENKEKSKFKSINIDSKIGKENNDRLEYIGKCTNNEVLKIKKMLKKNKNKFLKGSCNFNIHSASYLKGDVLYVSENKNIIIDAKDYIEIDGRMKFPYNDLKSNFIKSIDSNIKYLLLFDFILENRNFNKLFYYICNNIEIGENFGSFEVNLTKDEFSYIFKVFEYGLLYSCLRITDKYIVSHNKNKESIYVYKINLLNNLPNIINVSFVVLNKNYLYINFYANNELIYSLSQRSYSSNNPYRANCAFINKKFLDGGEIML